MKGINAEKNYWKLLKIVKGQEYYLEQISRYYKTKETHYQIFIIITTIIGIITLTNASLSDTYNILITILIVIAQVSTVLYPYIFQFSEKS